MKNGAQFREFITSNYDWLDEGSRVYNAYFNKSLRAPMTCVKFNLANDIKYINKVNDSKITQGDINAINRLWEFINENDR